MKKLLTVVMATLALNCLALLGAAAYVVQSAGVDRAKLMAVKDVLYPPATAPASQPATQPADGVAADPLKRLEELLANQTGRPMSEQVQMIQQRFDAQVTQLERRSREVADQQRQIDLAQAQLLRDREALDARQKQFEAEVAKATQATQDQGFAAALAVYQAMPAKQVKQIFMTLDDATVTRFMQALEPRQAAKIVKEFKTPAETERIQRVLEQIRKAELAQQVGTAASETPAGPQARN
jgi:hypothetical protein